MKFSPLATAKLAHAALARVLNFDSNVDLQRALGHVLAHPEQFREDFPEWLENNHHVYREFERRALKVWKANRRHYSARTIIETIRHDTVIGAIDGDFKVNNNMAPDLSRLFAWTHPDKLDLFEFRKRPSPHDVNENQLPLTLEIVEVAA